MVVSRRPFQGVKNIISFNWPFFLAAGISSLVFFFLAPISLVFFILAIIIILVTSASLLCSYWIYDRSNLYSLPWLDSNRLIGKKIFNIHSGFNELEHVLPSEFDITTLDFYNEQLHTEKSIQRARKKYPNSRAISFPTNNIPAADGSIDLVILFLSAHEIRNVSERNIFFSELRRILKTEGQVCITEHLRDLPNFLAYNIGFFHFHSKQSWLNCFKESGFSVDHQIKTTPFISTFILSET